MAGTAQQEDEVVLIGRDFFTAGRVSHLLEYRGPRRQVRMHCGKQWMFMPEELSAFLYTLCDEVAMGNDARVVKGKKTRMSLPLSQDTRRVAELIARRDKDRVLRLQCGPDWLDVQEELAVFLEKIWGGGLE